jgi:hypothetical protein
MITAHQRDGGMSNAQNGQSRPQFSPVAASLVVLDAARILAVQAADLQDLDPERLEPGEQPVQSRLVSNRAVQDSLDRFHRGAEPVEVEQRLGRKYT